MWVLKEKGLKNDPNPSMLTAKGMGIVLSLINVRKV